MPNRNLIVKPRHMPDVIKNKFVVISTDNEGFIWLEILQLGADEKEPIFKARNAKGETSWYGNTRIIARFGTAQMAATQCGKAKALEQQLRPMWQAAVEHEKRVKQLMLDQVYACARGGIG